MKTAAQTSTCSARSKAAILRAATAAGAAVALPENRPSTLHPKTQNRRNSQKHTPTHPHAHPHIHTRPHPHATHTHTHTPEVREAQRRLRACGPRAPRVQEPAPAKRSTARRPPPRRRPTSSRLPARCSRCLRRRPLRA
eukprot:363649-Chlamydomonas_euryale.AAC.9